MAITKRLNLNNIFIFLFLILFPFGQILRIGILHPLDVVIGFSALYAAIKKLPKPEFFIHMDSFLLIAFASWTLSLFIFPQIEVLYGFLYLLRLVGYFYFFIYVWNYARQSINNKKLLYDSLLIISIISALFGWVQYFVFPNLTPFFVWGWDDHFLRLTGTFLDPTFLGIVVVFGAIISIIRIIEAKEKSFFDILIFIFFVMSLAFTYSRASYLAFLAGLALLGFFKKTLNQIIIGFIAFALLILALPTSQNNVLKFTRVFSAAARVENYKETLSIFKTSPVFGVGYNNLCLVKAREVGFINFSSHACSGSDSSFLFVLATTGVVGLIIFLFLIFQIKNFTAFNKYSVSFYACGLALLAHSLFSNSIFYPWVLGFMLISLSLSLKK